MVIERLTGAGYVYIGMDHFAREDDDLTRALASGTLHRNFQGYTTYAQAEIYAMGMAVLMATHDAEVVTALRRRVVALEDGRVVRDEVGGYHREY